MCCGDGVKGSKERGAGERGGEARGASTGQRVGVGLKCASVDNGRRVLELGPGTGVVTEALLARGLDPRRLIAVEKSPCLIEVLRKRFPEARFVPGDALELDALFPGERFGAVVSSLPLQNFAAPNVARLAACIRAILDPGGCWIQFTYRVLNGQPPSDAFEQVDSELVLLNLPPALVCVYRPVTLDPARPPL